MNPYQDFYLNYVNLLLQTSKYLNGEDNLLEVCKCTNHCQYCFKCAYNYRNTEHPGKIADRNKFHIELPFILSKELETQDIIDKKLELTTYLSNNPIPKNKKKQFIDIIINSYNNFSKSEFD